jgi:hypothetical protein
MFLLFIKDDHEMILYNKDYLFYLPICADVKQITIVESKTNNEKCYKDIPIEYCTENNSKIKKRGFLRFDNVISQLSNEVSCSELPNVNMLIGDDVLSRVDGKYSVERSVESGGEILEMEQENLERLSEHHDYLTNNTNMLEELSSFMNEAYGTKDLSFVNGSQLYKQDEAGAVVVKGNNPFRTMYKATGNFFSMIGNTIVSGIGNIISSIFIVCALFGFGYLFIVFALPIIINLIKKGF